MPTKVYLQKPLHSVDVFLFKWKGTAQAWVAGVLTGKFADVILSGESLKGATLWIIASACIAVFGVLPLVARWIGMAADNRRELPRLGHILHRTSTIDQEAQATLA
jgi:hypothetical protein